MAKSLFALPQSAKEGLPLQEEVFTVLNGTMGYIADGVEGSTTKGVAVPVGKSHTFWNADPDTALIARVTSFTEKPHLLSEFRRRAYGKETHNLELRIQHYLDNQSKLSQ